MKNKRSKEEYVEAIKNSKSIAGVCRYLGIIPKGGNYKIVHKNIDLYKLDTSHFTGSAWNVGEDYRVVVPPQPLETILVEHSYYQSHKLKQRLIKENIKPHKCECCGRSQWEGYEIPLELHHINGINTDNRLENLQLLCPNCHALTDNYRSRNKTEYKATISQKHQELVIKTINNTKPKDRIKNHCIVCGKETKNKKYCSYECCHQDSRKVNITKEQLIQDFKEIKSFLGVAKKYGITDNGIRKWCRKYGLPVKTKNMLEFLAM